MYLYRSVDSSLVGAGDPAKLGNPRRRETELEPELATIPYDTKASAAG